MFCQKCGNSLSRGLKYCNSCGNRLTQDVEDRHGTPGKMLDNILTTMFLVVMFGMGILVGLVAVLLGNGVPAEPVALITSVYILAIFAICFTLGRQVPKLIDARLKASQYASPSRDMLQLDPLTTGQLDEYREPVMSVTDHTTRTLDEVSLKQR